MHKHVLLEKHIIIIFVAIFAFNFAVVQKLFNGNDCPLEKQVMKRRMRGEVESSYTI